MTSHASRPAVLRRSVRELPGAADAERVFGQLFAGLPTAFWLDSSLTAGPPGLGRASVLGTTAGSDAEVNVWKVADGNVFADLRARLAERAIQAGPVPGDGFAGGYVGYFGYELKVLTGGDTVHVSPEPDALWIWANRYVLIDHERDRTLLVAVHPAPDEADAHAWLARAEVSLRPGPAEPATPEPAIARLDLERHLEQSRKDYLAGIEACRVALEAGETYEVCLTNRVRLPAVADPLEFYRWQRRRNPAPYAAYLRHGELAVASSSPERFLTIDAGRWAECRPIKGTAPRLPDPAEDRAAARRLATDEKTRAENLMIVDLIRNDLGRVCEPGTVGVPQLMAVETYESAHQLVTTVRGRLRPDVDTIGCVEACFPPGSMTGAPKLRTMQLIDRLESSPRGIYSGVLGYLSPDGRADLSVVIRTAVLTPSGTTIGAGGAIVLDSDPDAEYDEMLLKATAAVRGRS